MELLTRPVVWIGGIVVVAFAGAFAAWLKGFFTQFLPPPQRTRLAIANAFKSRAPLPETEISLGVVLVGKRWCRTRHEHGRRRPSLVLRASNWFAPPVSCQHPGAADDWRPAMRKGTLAVLKKWNADLAVVGSVKDPGKAISLWFVPREGDGTLRRGDLPYELVNVRLQDDFHEDLRAQLTAEALRVAALIAGTEVRGRVLEKGLNGVIKKIAALLEGSAIESERGASLQMALGVTLAVLGERESGTEHLEQAVVAFTEALKEWTRDRVPLDWAKAQNNLGVTFSTLGERESGTEHLEQAVVAHIEALKERTRDRVPLDWATTQNNLGAALQP